MTEQGNNESKRARGRPLLFPDVAALQKAIDAYFESCWGPARDMFGNIVKDKETGAVMMKQYKPYTLSGLAVALGCSRITILNYSKEDDFFITIKEAKDKCEAYAEESLFIGKNPTGAMFNLKNNHTDWHDKQEHELSGGLSYADALQRGIKRNDGEQDK